METNKNYFSVGLFVIVIFFAALGFTLWLNSAGRGETADYRIRFADSVAGLEVGSAVKFRGVDVGEVRKMVIDPDDIRMIDVEVRVVKSAPVKTDTLASLKYQDISGDLYVELTGDNSRAADLGDTAKAGELPEIKSEKSGFTALLNRLPQITDKTDDLLEKANRIAAQVEKVFSDENVAVVNATIKKLAAYVGVKKPKAQDEDE